MEKLFIPTTLTVLGNRYEEIIIYSADCDVTVYLILENERKQSKENSEYKVINVYLMSRNDLFYSDLRGDHCRSVKFNFSPVKSSVKVHPHDKNKKKCQSEDNNELE